MQEFFIMIGLSVILAVAAFAEEPAPSSKRISQRPVVPVQGTATFVNTNTAITTTTGSNVRVYTNETTKMPTGVGGSVPDSPPKMPPEKPKPTGFN